MPSITDPRTYSFASPNSGAEAINERNSADSPRFAGGPDRPHLAFVNTSAMEAFATLDRVARSSNYQPTVTYPNNGFALALRTVAGSIVSGIGTRVYWVQTGGFDTHAGQGNAGGGGYANLMATLGDGVLAFYNDLQNQGLLGSTLMVQFSEFGRRISENGSQGTDHGAGGDDDGDRRRGARRHLRHRGRSQSDAGQPDARERRRRRTYETDFRSVYAKVLDGWMGTDSTAILGGNFRTKAPAFL